jgi:ERCC4-type nuclease
LFVDAAEQEQIRTNIPQTTPRSLFNQFKATERQEDFAESAEAEISKIDDVTMGSSRGIKHDLTPNSKKSNHPRAKRSLVGNYLMITS